MPSRRTSKFSATLKNGDVLKAIINFVSKSGGVLDLFFEPEGLVTVARDPRNVALYDVYIAEATWEKYECQENWHFMVTPKGLQRAMKVSEPGDSIEIRAKSNSSHDVKEPSQFQMFFRNPGFTFELEVKCNAIPDDYEATPSLDDVPSYDCEVMMPTTNFVRLARDFSVFGNEEDLKIAVTRSSGVTFSTGGPERAARGQKKKARGEMKLCESAAETDIRIRCRTPKEAFYSLLMISMFSLPPSVSKNVTFKMKENAPLLVDYALDDESYVRFYLAPKQQELDGLEDIEMEDD